MSETKKKTCQFKSEYDVLYKCPEPRLEDSEKGYCIFHEPRKDKDVDIFNKGIKRKLNNKDYNFTEYWFPASFEGVLFKSFTFEKSVDFKRCVFKGDPCFRHSTFEKPVDFQKSTFAIANFEYSIFKEEVVFLGCVFAKAEFVGSTFAGGAEIVGCIFEREVDFEWSTFKAPAYFGGSIFKGTVNFACSTFEAATYFEQPPSGAVEFEEPIFEKVILVDYMKSKDPYGAAALFRKAKIAWHREGNYVEEGKAHYQEMDYIRKQKNWFFRYFFDNIFHRLLHGYGEKPSRVILWAATIIAVCALLFMNFGIGETRLFGENLPTYNISKILFKLYNLSLTDLANIGRYFYFSVVTFTTLGYGDLRPVHPISHLISSIEAFTGMFMMALFVLTFSRKWRR